MDKKKILIVEDEPEILELVERSLRLKNFEVKPAGSGTQALAFFQQEKPDLAVIDILMPGLDGFEFCQKLRSQPGGNELPVVFLTVRNNPEDRQRAKALGALLYITKPFDPYKLGEEVERLLS